jgi:hypothetical protein
MGFKRAIVPADADVVAPDSSMKVVQVNDLKGAIQAGFSAEP